MNVQHDLYDQSDAITACRRCGKSWLTKNGDYIGYVSAEAEEAGVECPERIDGKASEK